VSDEETKIINNPLSFEERVFIQFEAISSRLSALERHASERDKDTQVQVVQILEGATRFDILVDEVMQSLELSAGMLVVVPQGCWHRFDSTTGCNNLRPGTFEQARKNPPIHGAVVRDQGGQMRSGGKVRAEFGFALLLRDDGRLCGDQRDVKAERTSLADLAPNHEPAAHCLNKSPADSQSQARAAGSRSGACLTELFKDTRQVFLRNTNPRIPYFESEALVCSPGNNQCHVAHGRELHGVAEEVQQHLPQVSTIDHNSRRKVRSHFDSKPQTLAAYGLRDDVGQIDC